MKFTDWTVTKDAQKEYDDSFFEEEFDDEYEEEDVESKYEDMIEKENSWLDRNGY